VKFALSLGVLNPSAWVAVTVEADRLGFDSVWIPEHLVLPVDMGGSPHDGQDHPPIPADIPDLEAHDISYNTQFGGQVVLSYRQTIFAYPSGGGSYVVSRENLGEMPSLVVRRQ